jgi:phospholipid transport system substrate-binding protein
MLDILDHPGGAERRAEFGRWLDDVFDLETMAILTLGPYRQGASPEQLEAYRRAFADYVVVTYEERFDTFTGYTFEVGQARPTNNNDIVVRTSVIDPSGNPLMVDFRVRDTGTEMQVIDVAVEGLSMLKTQRDEFSSVIQRNGLDALVAMLNQRVAAVVARD